MILRHHQALCINGSNRTPLKKVRDPGSSDLLSDPFSDEELTAEACAKRAHLFEVGFNGEKNEKAAERWFLMAAEKGHATSQYKIAHKAFVAKKYDEAVKWYRKAADQGFSSAQLELGNCYYYGYGVKQDYCLAVSWYKKAASKGNTYAKLKLMDSKLKPYI